MFLCIQNMSSFQSFHFVYVCLPINNYFLKCTRVYVCIHRYTPHTLLYIEGLQCGRESGKILLHVKPSGDIVSLGRTCEDHTAFGRGFHLLNRARGRHLGVVVFGLSEVWLRQVPPGQCLWRATPHPQEDLACDWICHCMVCLPLSP